MKYKLLNLIILFSVFHIFSADPAAKLRENEIDIFINALDEEAASDDDTIESYDADDETEDFLLLSDDEDDYFEE